MHNVPAEKSLLRLLVEATDAAEATLRDSFTGTPLQGVTWAQVTVFRELELGGPATVSELARTIGVTAQAMGECVRRLERHGLVTVARDPRDSRARMVSISGLGLAMVHRVWQQLGHLQTRLAAMIGPDGVDDLRRSLALIPELRTSPKGAETQPTPF